MTVKIPPPPLTAPKLNRHRSGTHEIVLECLKARLGRRVDHLLRLKKVVEKEVPLQPTRGATHDAILDAFVSRLGRRCDLVAKPTALKKPIIDDVPDPLVQHLRKLLELTMLKPRCPDDLLSVAKAERIRSESSKPMDKALILVNLPAAATKAANSKTTQNEYHAKGTGFGYNGRSVASAADVLEMKKKKKERDSKIIVAMVEIGSILGAKFSDSAARLMRLRVALLPALESFLRASELELVGDDMDLYLQVYSLLIALAQAEGGLGRSLFQRQPDQAKSLLDLIREQVAIAVGYLANVDAAGGSKDKAMKKLVELGEFFELPMSPSTAAETKEVDPSDSPADSLSHLSEEDLYAEKMKAHVFDEVSIDLKNLHANIANAASNAKGAKRPGLRRLKRELRQMRKPGGLPISMGSTIGLRYDKERPYVVQFMITGPGDTPYNSGCFRFDMAVTPEYPVKPPEVKIGTTGGGSVRFNPNLYSNGKVCLSLLGTWNGPGWSPTSTILQVLISIQSAILGVKYPYFNEPGVEKQRGTDAGRKGRRTATNGGYERLRVATLQWSMVDQLRNPDPGFEEFIKEHFRNKRRYILEEVCKPWLQEAKASPTSGHFAALKAQVDALKAELDKLCPEAAENKKKAKAAKAAFEAAKLIADAVTKAKAAAEAPAVARAVAETMEMPLMPQTCVSCCSQAQKILLNSNKVGPWWKGNKRPQTFVHPKKYEKCADTSCKVCAAIGQAIAAVEAAEFEKKKQIAKQNEKQKKMTIAAVEATVKAAPSTTVNSANANNSWVVVAEPTGEAVNGGKDGEKKKKKGLRAKCVGCTIM